jgi:hypothetical protein
MVTGWLTPRSLCNQAFTRGTVNAICITVSTGEGYRQAPALLALAAGAFPREPHAAAFVARRRGGSPRSGRTNDASIA